MTGGLAVILGPTGRNFGAGMTNGLAYVYDPEGEFDRRINGESILVERGLSIEDEARLRGVIERHVELTGSAHGQRLLDNWKSTVATTWKVIPRATLLLQATTPEEVEARGVAD
jgi:glutamate synthase domain-containing protein 3